MIRRFLMLVIGVGLAAAAIVAGTQQPTRVPRVGVLITHAPVDDAVVESFRRGMGQYGYQDGDNVKLEVRSAMGQLERVPALADELVRIPVDAIVVVNDASLRAASQATRTIPIVMIGWTVDPVSLGVIESYRHPGSNVTGFYSMPAELFGKRLEILKEALPRASRVAVLYDEFGRPQLPELQRAARSLGIRLEPVEFKGPEGLAAAFASAKRKSAGAVLLAWSPVFYVHRARVARLALEAGLPTVTDSDINVEAGCLLSYGFSVFDNFERAGYFVDRLLKGAKPADLPVEQISKLKLVVNLRTAKSLRVKIPESVLLRADEVIR
jgi:putative ABC transport system substrate-binding protein